MAQNSNNKKIANSLVAVSSAAVMAVYAAGYTRTQSAADKFEAQAAVRRPAVPRPGRTTSAVPESRSAGREAALDASSRITPAPSAPSRDEPDKSNLIASVSPLPASPTAPVVNVPDAAAALSYGAPAVSQPVAPAAPVVEHKAESAPAPAPVATPAPVAAAATPAQPVNPAAPPWKDGTYYGWGTCRHGDLQAAVVIQNGKIASAKVSECDTRYSCDVIDILPPQVAQRQSPEVDNVSGATQSADAFYGAVYNALLGEVSGEGDSGEGDDAVPVRSEVAMGTVVTIHVVPSGADVDIAMDRAFGWFHAIEERCTRFNPQSELMQLTAEAGVPVAASAILYEAVRFALLVAEESGGAFDPTVGDQMAARGFNREHRTGEIVATAAPDADVSYRDVELDPERRTITLLRPLTLDLGAVAKGLAVDTAARELEPFRDFSIDAGGDLYLGGSNPKGEPWSVGIRHPRRNGEVIDCLRVSNLAVCTSGDYERGQHILDPRTGEPGHAVASVTVVAPGAMLADALATAAFALGPDEGIQFLNRMGVEGLILTPQLERYETGGVPHAA